MNASSLLPAAPSGWQAGPDRFRGGLVRSGRRDPGESVCRFGRKSCRSRLRVALFRHTGRGDPGRHRSSVPYEAAPAALALALITPLETKTRAIMRGNDGSSGRLPLRSTTGKRHRARGPSNGAMSRSELTIAPGEVLLFELRGIDRGKLDSGNPVPDQVCALMEVFRIYLLMDLEEGDQRSCARRT